MVAYIYPMILSATPVGNNNNNTQICTRQCSINQLRNYELQSESEAPKVGLSLSIDIFKRELKIH